MMKKNRTYLFFIFLANSLFGQQFFSKNIDFDDYADIGNSIHQTDMGFVLTGTSFCNNNLSECYSILNTDLFGNVTNFVQYQNFPLWITAGSSLGNVGVAIKNPTEYYFSGAIQVGSPQYDIFLMKTDAQGDTIWMKTYGNSTLDEGTKSLIFSSDTSLLLLNALVLNQDKYLVSLLNVDLEGNIIWEKILGEDYKDAGYQDVIKLDNGDILVSYLTSEYNVPSSPYSMTVTKLDGQGNEKWTSRFASYDGYLSGAESNILALDNGGYLVNYLRDTFGFSNYPPIFVWLDSMGNVTQQYNFSNARIFTIGDLIKTADGRIIGVGQVDLIDYDMGYAGWVFCFTQSGEMLWERYIVDQHFLPEKLSWFSGVDEMDDGRLAIVGAIDTPPDFDAWLVVLDSMGCLEPGCTGEFQGYFSDVESVEGQSSKIMIYPNPVKNDVIHLSGIDGLLLKGDYVVRINDAMGRLVIIQNLSDEVDIRSLPKGFYVLSVMGQDVKILGVGRFFRG